MSHEHHHDSDSNLGIAFFLNVVFTIIEIIGGIYTNSLAILSDAIHDLGDSLSLGLAWYLEKISDRPGDFNYTYGYKRFSVLGAIITSVILIVGSIYIIQSAIPRIINPQPVHSIGMIILSGFGILFNGLGFWKTHHGHSHNEKIVSLHLLEDLLGWVAVLIGAILIYFYNWYWIDPFLSLLIALFIIYNVVRHIKKTINIILQGTPEQIDIDHVKKRLMGLPEVVNIHDLHIWTMDGHQNILTAHIVVASDSDMEAANHLKALIHDEMKKEQIHHCTLEIEREGEICSLKDQTSFMT